MTIISTEPTKPFVLERIQCMRDKIDEYRNRIEQLKTAYINCCETTPSSSSSSSSIIDSSSSSSSGEPILIMEFSNGQPVQFSNNSLVTW